jgi:hypothetical protein
MPSQARELGLRLEVHHRLPKGRGGRDVPENGVVLCGLGNSVPGSCHWMVDHNRAEAIRRGLILESGADPRAVPLEDWDSRLWWLLPNGTKCPLSAEEMGAA